MLLWIQVLQVGIIGTKEEGDGSNCIIIADGVCHGFIKDLLECSRRVAAEATVDHVTLSDEGVGEERDPPAAPEPLLGQGVSDDDDAGPGLVGRRRRHRPPHYTIEHQGDDKSQQEHFADGFASVRLFQGEGLATSPKTHFC